VAVVVLQGLAGDEVVVQVGEEERQVAKNSVHEPLEGLGGVFKSERHV
jgi:hypothetical protein